MTNETEQTGSPASQDLEKLPVDQVLTALAVEPEKGLNEGEVQKRLTQYGPNALIEKEESMAMKILHHFIGPIAYMIEAAALVSALIGHWEDFAIITTLLLFNVGLEVWQDRKASNALAVLKEGLAPEATVRRSGKWQTVQSSTLVPGDIVKIRLGVIVPADLRIVSGDYASIDQAALTGESLPVAKKIGDQAYSGSVVKQGELEAVVITTGSNTFFGRTAKLVAGAGAVSHAQKAAILVAIGMLRASSGLDLMVQALSTLTDTVELPAKALPMVLMRPLSGSGAYGILASIINDPAIGPDSYTGHLVSPLQGSTETTFYVMAVYFGAIQIRRVRYPCRYFDR